MRGALGLACVIGTGVLASASPSHAQTWIDAPLTSLPSPGGGVTVGVSGGTFSAAGWRTTGDEDSLWVEIPAAIPSGSVEVTVGDLSTATNLTGALHDVLVLYGGTDAAEPVTYAPYFRSNDFKVQIRIIGTAETSRGPGASKLELRRCPAGAPGHHEPCPAGCGETVESAYLNGAPLAPLAWDASRTYRLRVVWSPGSITYDRGEAPVTIDFPGTYAPERLVVRLGSPRHRAGTPDRMPVGMFFRDLVVRGASGVASPDCTGAPSGPCLRAVSLTPASSTGTTAILRGVYAHCDGASAFRIAQIWVGDEVAAGVPAVGGWYEGGRFGLGALSCAPGEAMLIPSDDLGAIDCALSSATASGDALTVDWALRFDAARFGGAHGVFFDAKGGAGTPEPRLGWTRMGDFTVVTSDAGLAPPDGGLDAGVALDGGARDGGIRRGGSLSTCGCRASRGEAPLLLSISLAAIVARAARPRTHAGAGRCTRSQRAVPRSAPASWRERRVGLLLRAVRGRLR